MSISFSDYLCCGYDAIHNSYANPQRMTFIPILNRAELEKKVNWYMSPKGISHSASEVAISQNQYEMEQVFDTSCGVSYNALNISASLTTSTSQSTFISGNSVYGKVFSSHQTGQYSLTLAPKEIPKFVTESFLEDVKNYDPETVFKTYGTHLIQSFEVGGRMVMEFFMADKKNKSMEEIKAAAKAKYSSLEGNISASSKESIMFFTSNSDIQLWAIGGNPATLMDWDDRKEVISQWMNSLTEKPALYDVRLSIPLWDLVEDAALKEKLRKGFNTYYKAALTEAMNRIPFITDLRVVMSKNSSIGGQLKSGEYITQMNPGHGPYNSDLNAGAGGKYIYLVYKLSTDYTQKITDVRIISNSSDKSTPAPGYTVIHDDLNKDAGGYYIYPEYKRENSAESTGIYALGTRESTIPFSDDWVPVRDQDNGIPDLNKKAGGKYIYLFYYQHPYFKHLKAVKDSIKD